MFKGLLFALRFHGFLRGAVGGAVWFFLCELRIDGHPRFVRAAIHGFGISGGVYIPPLFPPGFDFVHPFTRTISYLD